MALRNRSQEAVKEGLERGHHALELLRPIEYSHVAALQEPVDGLMELTYYAAVWDPIFAAPIRPARSPNTARFMCNDRAGSGFLV